VEVTAGSKYRRTASVLVVIGLAMLICAKVSVASHRPGGVTALAQTVLEAAGETGKSFVGTKAQNQAAIDAKASMTQAKAGWDKSTWSSGDWASYIIPGPLITCIAVAAVFGMYGPAYAGGLAVVLITVDVVAFYINI
jgi:hypothetical protein